MATITAALPVLMSCRVVAPYMCMPLFTYGK